MSPLERTAGVVLPDSVYHVRPAVLKPSGFWEASVATGLLKGPDQFIIGVGRGNTKDEAEMKAEMLVMVLNERDALLRVAQAAREVSARARTKQTRQPRAKALPAVGSPAGLGEPVLYGFEVPAQPLCELETAMARLAECSLEVRRATPHLHAATQIRVPGREVLWVADLARELQRAGEK